MGRSSGSVTDRHGAGGNTSGSVTVMAAPELPIHTDRLVLRRYRVDDLAATHEYFSDPEVARYLPFGPWTDDDARIQLEKRIGRTDIDGPGTGLALAVELAPPDSGIPSGTGTPSDTGIPSHTGPRLIGDVSLWVVDDTLSRAELGWVFHPDFGGRGLATEAVRATLEIAFDHYGMHRVIAQVDARNTASARLCERVGMTREAHLRQDWWDSGEWTDALIYGMLAEDRKGCSDA